MKIRCAFIAIALIALLGGSQALAGVIYVRQRAGPTYDGQTWATAYNKVQDAVNAAAGNDEVWVAAGVYTENIALKSGVALYGGFAGTETARTERNWSANQTVLDGNWAGAVVEIATSANSSTRVDGFVIRNGRAVLGGGIYCGQSAAPVIANNRICGNSSSSDGGGIYCNMSSAPTIANNTISNNGAAGNGGGVCSMTGASKLMSNVVCNNAARRGGAVSCGDTTSTVLASHEYVVNNTIVANSASYGGGIYCWPGSSASVSNNVIAFNSSGICKEDGSGAPALKKNCVYGNDGYNYYGIAQGATDMVADPLLASADYGNLHLQPGSPCRETGNNAEVIAGWFDMDGQTRVVGTVDIGADESDGTVWSVWPVIVRVAPNGDDANDGSGWGTAKRSIQAAVDAAASVGGQVWVKAGTYGENIELRDGVYVYGGFSGWETSLAQRDWRMNATIIDGGADGCVVRAERLGYRVSAIDGFTLRNGKDLNGAGVLCDHASPVVMNNVITGNEASANGAGIYLANSAALVKNNVIRGNSAVQSGGGLYAQHSSAEIVGNSIDDNAACLAGAGFHASAEDICRLVNNLITSNRALAFNWVWGTALSMASYATPDLVCNTVTNNALDSYAVYYGVYGKVRLHSNVFAFNGSGIRGDKNTATVENMNNCIHQIVSFTYSGVEAGLGDITVDPLFVDQAARDYRLQAGSPCLDMADSGSAPADDKLGMPRPLDGDGNRVSQADMGCYEYSRGFDSLKDAREKGEGDLVATTGLVSTAKFSGSFYMEDPRRTRGVGVVGSCAGTDREVTVEGTMTTVNGERMIQAYNVIDGSAAPAIRPLALTNRDVGGGASGQQNAVWDWRVQTIDGTPTRVWAETAGLNNVGMLTVTFGKVLAVDEGAKCFWIDDGSRRANFAENVSGLKVKSSFGLPGIGQNVGVAGIVSCEPDATAQAGELLPVIVVRQAADVVVF